MDKPRPPCIVAGCQQEPFILDSKNYTKWVAFNPSETPLDLLEGEAREIWYCQEHASAYLFPVIDRQCGNTAAEIIREFKNDGMWR